MSVYKMGNRRGTRLWAQKHGCALISSSKASNEISHDNDEHLNFLTYLLVFAITLIHW